MKSNIGDVRITIMIMTRKKIVRSSQMAARISRAKLPTDSPAIISTDSHITQDIILDTVSILISRTDANHDNDELQNTHLSGLHPLR